MVQATLPTLCLLLQSVCANVCGRGGTFYESGATVVVILCGVRSNTESADAAPCDVNQAVQATSELAKPDILKRLWHHAKVMHL